VLLTGRRPIHEPLKVDVTRRSGRTDCYLRLPGEPPPASVAVWNQILADEDDAAKRFLVEQQQQFTP